MRQDIAKVICERERRGSRDYMNCQKGYEAQHLPRRTNREDIDEDYQELENLPKHESMTKRLGYDPRSFSDRLGAIKGLVRKAEGKPWDKVYSELCSHVSPTGTVVEQHVHQHLHDYICTDTRIDDDGDVECLGSWGGWVYPHQLWQRQDFYVHPTTGLVTKIKRRETRRVGNRGYRARQATEKALVAKPGPRGIEFHKIDGTWFALRIELARYETTTRVINERIYETRHNVNPSILSIDLVVKGDYRVVEKRALNGKQLKRLGVSND